MNNKGFTLIELLGVIIILALIMLIAFPNIINSIKKTNDKIDEKTLELIYNASDIYINNHIEDFPKKSENKYIIEFNNLIGEDLLSGDLKTSNSDNITNTKCIQVTYDNGYKYELKDSGECEYYIWGPCSRESSSNSPDIITCDDQEFYVIDEDDKYITMLTKLFIGDTSKQTTASFTRQFSGVVGTSAYYKASGYSNKYRETLGTNYVYDENSPISQYVEAYKNYLINSLEVNVQDARLLSYSEVISACGSNDCSSTDWIKCSPEGAQYWLGNFDTSSNSYLYRLYCNGTMTREYYSVTTGRIRPVIIIPKTDIEINSQN